MFVAHSILRCQGRLINKNEPWNSGLGKAALAFNSFWAIISGSRLEKICAKIYFYGNSK
jgi:hypothetical protein